MKIDTIKNRRGKGNRWLEGRLNVLRVTQEGGNKRKKRFFVFPLEEERRGR